jgi:hypothetical protein
VTKDKPIPTRVGHAGWTDHRHFGYSLFEELAGNVSSTGLIVLAATGEKIDDDSCAMLDDVATILTVADPRIYPLKLVRLATAYGDPLAGLSTAVAAMQGAIVGPQISQNAAFLLREIADELGDEPLDSPSLRRIIDGHFERKGRISGFGVPFRHVDERATALAGRVLSRGRAEGRYWKLQEKIAEIILNTRNLACNVGLPVAGLSLDMGFCPEDLSALYTGLTMNVFLANAVEGAAQAPAVLRRLPVSSVEYTGKALRKFVK